MSVCGQERNKKKLRGADLEHEQHEALVSHYQVEKDFVAQKSLLKPFMAKAFKLGQKFRLVQNPVYVNMNRQASSPDHQIVIWICSDLSNKY